MQNSSVKIVHVDPGRLDSGKNFAYGNDHYELVCEFDVVKGA